MLLGIIIIMLVIIIIIIMLLVIIIIMLLVIISPEHVPDHPWSLPQVLLDKLRPHHPDEGRRGVVGHGLGKHRLAATWVIIF